MELTAASSFLTIKAAQPVNAVWVHSLFIAQSDLFLASLCSVAQLCHSYLDMRALSFLQAGVAPILQDLQVPFSTAVATKYHRY